MPRFIKLPIFYFMLINLLVTGTCQAEENFPGRTKYKTVPYITLEDLYAKKDSVIIVDARSNYEYSILHITNAINIPISGLEFTKQIQEIAKKNKPIVFYCNGHACTKSYDAVLKAKRLAKVTNTMAFDAGIADWVERYPEHSILLNMATLNPASLISDKEFQKHQLKPRAFLDRSNSNCIILDVRDSTQRTDRIFAGYEHSVNLDNTQQLELYLDEAKKGGKALCIYDAVGEQVRWLQYHLKSRNITNYFFLKGGAKAFYATPYKELYDN